MSIKPQSLVFYLKQLKEREWQTMFALNNMGWKMCILQRTIQQHNSLSEWRVLQSSYSFRKYFSDLTWVWIRSILTIFVLQLPIWLFMHHYELLIKCKMKDCHIIHDELFIFPCFLVTTKSCKDLIFYCPFHKK